MMFNKNQSIQNSEIDTHESNNLKLNRKRSVDINILLNRVRAGKKKERLETFITISLVCVSILVTGLIFSL